MIEKLLQIILLYSIPLRESAGFRIGLPLRVGEILMLVYPLFIIFKTKINSKKKLLNCSRETKAILILLFLNLCFSLLIGKISNVNNDFFLKYIIRNFMVFFFILSIVIKPLKINRKTFDDFFKFMVIIQLLFFFLQLLGFNINFFELIKFPLGRRFQGTASEAGYLPTLLAPAIYYFRKSKINKRYYYIAIFELIMTFSSFGYFVLAIEGLLKLKKLNWKKQQLILAPLVCIILIIIMMYKGEVVEEKIMFNVNKVVSYSKGESFDFSVKARNQQKEYIKERIKNLSTFRKIVGAGTGRYSKIMNSEVRRDDFYELADEGHTLYLSTIHDRGILGITILLLIFYQIGKLIYIQRKDKIIISFSYIYFLQIIHWKLTANMWLYFFWITLAIFISRLEEKKRIKKKIKRRINGLNKYYNTNL